MLPTSGIGDTGYQGISFPTPALQRMYAAPAVTPAPLAIDGNSLRLQIHAFRASCSPTTMPLSNGH